MEMARNLSESIIKIFSTFKRKRHRQLSSMSSSSVTSRAIAASHLATRGMTTSTNLASAVGSSHSISSTISPARISSVDVLACTGSGHLVRCICNKPDVTQIIRAASAQYQWSENKTFEEEAEKWEGSVVGEQGGGGEREDWGERDEGFKKWSNEQIKIDRWVNKTKQLGTDSYEEAKTKQANHWSIYWTVTPNNTKQYAIPSAQPMRITVNCRFFSRL